MINCCKPTDQNINILTSQEFDENEPGSVNQVVVDHIDEWLRSKPGVTFLHLNIRSIHKNWDELKILLENQVGRFHVFAFIGSVRANH
jgi:ankyrin repeat protein